MRKILTAALLSAITHGALATEHIVEMKNMGADGTMVFEPGLIQVAVGDTVRFVATDPAHNSESVAGLVPEGAQGWKGALNEEISITVDSEGVYVYQCLPHSALAMVGVIVAGEPVNLAQIKEQATALTGTFLMNQDRLDTYLSAID